MSGIEFIAKVLEAYAWPLFFTILILLFKSKILETFTFFGSLIKTRGLKGKYGASEIQIPPDDPDTSKQVLTNKVREKTYSSFSISSSSKSLSNSSSSKSLSNISSQKQGNGGHDNLIIMGFLNVKTNESEINDSLNINFNPEMKTFYGDNPEELKHYEIGQKVYFAIKNISDIKLVMPLCHVQFPSKFKHLSTEQPETGLMTINSELWGIGGISTELINLDSKITEISGIIGRELKPGQVAQFFIRFKIPKTKNSFDIIMKLKVDGYDAFEKKLVLNTNQ